MVSLLYVGADGKAYFACGESRINEWEAGRTNLRSYNMVPKAGDRAI